MEGNGKSCGDWQFMAFCYHSQHKIKLNVPFLNSQSNLFLKAV